MPTLLCCGKEMKEMETETIKAGDPKDIVKSRYDACAEQGGGEGVVCCAGDTSASPSFAAEHGLYSREELSLVPKIAFTLSRGCGNPAGFADLQPGEVVVDFGCGAGIDVVLAAHKVGSAGKVVGVDMTPHMIERAKQSVAEAHVDETTEFLLADLEQVELPDGFADVVISNCVINLCPDKEAVYREAFRVLKPGGHFVVIDHRAPDGAPATTGGVTHRLAQDTLMDMMGDVGLVLVEESDLLANPDDDGTLNVFDPSIRRQTDRYILKFEKS